MIQSSGSFVYVKSCRCYNSNEISYCLQEVFDIFKSCIRPNDLVCLKPNWLAEHHKYLHDEWQSVITHPSIITSVLGIVLELLSTKGKVIIVDAPQTDSNWNRIMQKMDVDIWKSMAHKAGVSLSIIDLRDEEWKSIGDVIVSKKKLPGDPLDSVTFNLGEESEFFNHIPSKEGYYGADYDFNETNQAHIGNKHLYRVSRSVMSADVIINIPKLKTHKKAGITCSLKNLVGINTHKNFLPHYSLGTPISQGDQYPFDTLKYRSERMLTSKYKNIICNFPILGYPSIPFKFFSKYIFGSTSKNIRSGNWFGNETLWRTIIDLNRILFFGNPDGTFRSDSPENKKKYITIVDGIIAGEGDGPEEPVPKNCGIFMVGTNPVAMDAACAKIMGFDWQKIPMIRNSFNLNNYPLADFTYNDICIRSDISFYNKFLYQIRNRDTFHFEPHFGWKGNIELEEGS